MKRSAGCRWVGMVWIAACAWTSCAAEDVLGLHFQRLASRRFVFSQRILLAEFAPAETIAFSSMHPAFLASSNATPVCDTAFAPRLDRGRLTLESTADAPPACFYVGAVNPFATFDVSFERLEGEAGIDLARHGLRDRVQVVACGAAAEDAGVFLRVWTNAVLARNLRLGGPPPAPPFTLRAQLSGRNITVFTEKDGVTHEDLSPVLDGGRVWAGVVPLPDGYPHRHVLLTMDRANFPDVKAPTWSYGALYFYGADAPPQTGGAPSPQ